MSIPSMPPHHEQPRGAGPAAVLRPAIFATPRHAASSVITSGA